jgi:hypothetical protein
LKRANPTTFFVVVTRYSAEPRAVATGCKRQFEDLPHT